ncbi:MAG: bifunctional 4-hydroxy-2-oxoglutarate aldolase/2-dehydro-3-deoxy-phosphogluconate aldolase [Cellvibrionaceae bacterium]|nr:bifunctional 4-hydroxy-2-oxoglutarate aldolase/2-dehydro-3-deoxy-phosphogluconate aldolase [Cellvibrionaceae bacterium]
MKITRAALAELKIIPVLTPISVDKTLKMTEAMVKGGIRSVEITLRTDCAFDAIAAVKQADLGVSVGVGTVTSAALVEKVADIGCDYVVTPGITPALLDAAKATQINLLPGVSGPSELMLGMEYGYDHFKLFPAGVINAMAMLKAFAGPFHQINFCPTGGIGLNNAADYLALPNVVCVGGSWMMPKDAIAAEDWERVTTLSAQAMAL